jgi:hypothetical protein
MRKTIIRILFRHLKCFNTICKRIVYSRIHGNYNYDKIRYSILFNKKGFLKHTSIKWWQNDVNNANPRRPVSHPRVRRPKDLRMNPIADESSIVPSKQCLQLPFNFKTRPINRTWKTPSKTHFKNGNLYIRSPTTYHSPRRPRRQPLSFRRLALICPRRMISQE